MKVNEWAVGLTVFLGCVLAMPPQAAKQAKPVVTMAGTTIGLIPACKTGEVLDYLGRCVPTPLPPIVAPIEKDVVTHSEEQTCPKGYKMATLMMDTEVPEVPSAAATGYLNLTIGEPSEEFPVCVTPAFIRELRAGDQR